MSAIEVATQPVNPVLGDIAGELAATQRALGDLLASQAAEAHRSPAPAAAGNGPFLVSRLPKRRG